MEMTIFKKKKKKLLYDRLRWFLSFAKQSYNAKCLMETDFQNKLLTVSAVCIVFSRQHTTMASAI